jgi:hypothetical protein
MIEAISSVAIVIVLTVLWRLAICHRKQRRKYEIIQIYLGRSFAFGPFCLAHSTSSKEEAGMHKVAPEQRAWLIIK